MRTRVRALKREVVLGRNYGNNVSLSEIRRTSTFISLPVVVIGDRKQLYEGGVSNFVNRNAVC